MNWGRRGCGRDGWEAWLNSRPTTHQLKHPNCLCPPPTPILPQGWDQLDSTKRTQDKRGMLVSEVTPAPKQIEEQDREGRPVVRARQASHHAQTEGTMPASPSQRTKAQVDGLCFHLGCSRGPYQSPWRISENGAGIQLWFFSGPRRVCQQEPTNGLHFGGFFPPCK